MDINKQLGEITAEITAYIAAEAETINAENRIILAEAAAGNFAALLKLITVTTVKMGGI